jgi:hypothetical protein
MKALKMFYMSLTKLIVPPAYTMQGYGSSEGVLHEPDQAHSPTSRYIGTRQAMEALKMFHKRQPKLTVPPTGRKL